MQDFDGEHPSFRVLATPGSRKLAIFFSGTNKTDGQFDFWGYVHSQVAANILLVNNGAGNHWYQLGVPGLGNSVETTVESIREIGRRLGADRIYTIGASMGGSGAVLYGALLGGRVLGFSFETRLRAPGSRSAKYIPADLALPYPDLLPLMQAGAADILGIYGEADPVDMVEAVRVRDVRGVQLITMRGVDHGVPRYLRSRNRLAPLLDAFLADDALPDLPERDDGADVPGFAEALYAAHRALAARNTSAAMTAASEAVTLRRTSDHAQMLLGKSLMRAGRFEVAMLHLGLALALAPDNPETRTLLGSCMRKLGRSDHAIAFHEETLRRWPDYARAHYEIGLVHLGGGRILSAVAALRQACALAPGDKTFAARLAKIERAASAEVQPALRPAPP